jgi:branched-chain amino acid transport system permease protein
MSRFVDSRFVVVTLVSVLLLLEPLAALATHNGFLLVVSTRIVIMAIAASSLNLILGYGGMVSFGHAAYLGIGGYAVGILAHSGINSGFVQWPVAIVASATFALAVGLLSLRTRGVYFIMITLAFAQMVYYVATGLDEFGGDDGLTIYRRSEFAGLIDLSNKMVFYYLCLGLLAGTVFLVWRVANSRFGLVIQGSRSNDRRMHALGFPTYRYRVV